MDGLTTNPAPPDVEPATMRIASPFDFWKALTAGLGPTNAASIESANSASTASGPALNVAVCSLFWPSACWKNPFSTPTIAGACVMFGR